MRSLVALTLLLAACGRAPDRQNDLDQLDRELTDANSLGNTRVPAIARALHDQIKVDPGLTRSSNAKADCPRCRTKARARTLGALAEQQPGGAACATVTYSAAWANRLPTALPLYPDARVTEAAGNTSGRCALRVVSFRSSAGAAKLIDWYYTHATAGGYSADHRTDGAMRVLGGTHGGDAYVVYVTPRQGGADVDLVTNAGR